MPIRGVIASILAIGLGVGGWLLDVGEAGSTPLPSACVYVALDANGLVTTTIVEDTDGMTCTSLPPTTTNDPCPNGQLIHEADDNLGVEHEVFVCIEGL